MRRRHTVEISSGAIRLRQQVCVCVCVVFSRARASNNPRVNYYRNNIILFRLAPGRSLFIYLFFFVCIHLNSPQNCIFYATRARARRRYENRYEPGRNTRARDVSHGRELPLGAGRPAAVPARGETARPWREPNRCDPYADNTDFCLHHNYYTTRGYSRPELY